MGLQDGRLTLDAGEFRLELLPLLNAEGETGSYWAITPPWLVFEMNLQFTKDETGEPVILTERHTSGRGVAQTRARTPRKDPAWQ